MAGAARAANDAAHKTLVNDMFPPLVVYPRRANAPALPAIPPERRRAAILPRQIG